MTLVALLLPGCAAMFGPDRTLTIDVPANVVVVDIASGDTVAGATSRLDDGAVSYAPSRHRVTALRLQRDSAVQVQVVRRQWSWLSLLNVLSPAMAGFAVDDLLGAGQAPVPSRVRYTDSLATAHPDSIARQEAAARQLANDGRWPCSVFNSERTAPLAYVAFVGGYAGGTTPVVLIPANLSSRLGIVVVPWATVWVEAGTFQTHRMGDLTDAFGTTFGGGFRLAERSLGLFVSGVLARGAVRSEGKRDGTGTTGEGTFVQGGLAVGITTDFGAIEYRHQRILDWTMLQSNGATSLAASTNGLFFSAHIYF